MRVAAFFLSAVLYFFFTDGLSKTEKTKAWTSSCIFYVGMETGGDRRSPSPRPTVPFSSDDPSDVGKWETRVLGSLGRYCSRVRTKSLSPQFANPCDFSPWWSVQGVRIYEWHLEYRAQKLQQLSLMEQVTSNECFILKLLSCQKQKRK